MKTVKKETMDGNTAAAYASYAFTECAAIYPITPSSVMAERVDEWAARGKKNIFGDTVKIVEMQSEAGAISAVHGSLEAGALTTTYTASQGLLLMIPTMARISGQLKPGVMHVASRSIAYHAYSIAAEHSDVMACRSTGWAMLCSSSVQEAMDLGAVAHLASIKSSVPFMHFFDGMRTSHELQKIELLDYDDLKGLVDEDALNTFRKRSMNPDRPVNRTSGQTQDVYFQAREACNPYYDKVPEIVEETMNRINELTGRDYKLFNYYGDPEAEHIIIGLGSVAGAGQEIVEYLTAQGKKVGYLSVRLYRPFSVRHFLKEIPSTVKTVTVLDRTKESGAIGEPLFEDVCAAFNESDLHPLILAGRYGLGGRDINPTHLAAIYENAASVSPRNHFTIGIEDDLTGLSLPVGRKIDLGQKDIYSCKFWGFGSDGTVGANRSTIKIIGDHTDMKVQAYFQFDGRKSGGVTKSHLRFGQSEIRSSYFIDNADFVACHKTAYIQKYDMHSELKPGGSFLLNCDFKPEELDEKLPADFRKYIADNDIKFYTIDASGIAKKLGLGSRTNTILQAAFFCITEVIPLDDAVKFMKEEAQKAYGAKGDDIVKMNHDAIDRGVEGVVRIGVPEYWSSLDIGSKAADKEHEYDFIKDHLIPANMQKSNDLPVSKFATMADGTMPSGTSKYDKRGIAVDVPCWDPAACIQCNQCSLVCPHAAIRPFLLTEEEADAAPEGFAAVKANGKNPEGYKFAIVVDPLDCTGCGSCATVCPSKTKALTMKPLATQLPVQKNWDYAIDLSEKDTSDKYRNIKQSQFAQPLLEFPGACPGCGETPYAKLVTQLFGDRMTICTATGCSLVWSNEYPVFPYTSDRCGHGPAANNSLFENNAEFAYGVALGSQRLRQRIKGWAERLEEITADDDLRQALTDWIEAFSDNQKTRRTTEALKKALAANAGASGEEAKLTADLLKNQDLLVKQSNWAFGGDGWAYDIGYGGLDHILSFGLDLNILIMDTEVYSNTGGQSSKATPRGAIAQFDSSGRKSRKKDLGKIIMSYENVYVAQVAMGADQNQLIKALVEAESYPGTSVILAYAPCINHGLRCGMHDVQNEIKRAVDAGYWHLYRYDPRRKAEGLNPFQLDSREPKGDFQQFLKGETRYAALNRTFPENAEVLQKQAEEDARARYEDYVRLAKQE